MGKSIKKGYLSLFENMNGSTEIIEELGLDIIETFIESYKIIASAVKYLADIIHVDQNNRLKDRFWETTGEIKREILFSGGITIYQKQIIHGTSIKGYDLKKCGRIWMSHEPSKILQSNKGLQEIILSDNPVIQIEKILNGYEKQQRDSSLYFEH